MISHEDYPVLLGLNWFHQTGAGIYPRENILKLPGRTVKLNSMTTLSNEDEDSQVMVSEVIDDEDIATEIDWDFKDSNIEIKPHDPNLLSKKELIEFKNLVQEIKSVVAKDIKELPSCNIAKHVIRVHSSVAPIYIAPYRKSHFERNILKEHINEMLDAGIIEPSSSAWSAPVLMIPKSDGSQRFCVDYRRLNAVTITETWPMPRSSDIFDNLSGSNYFSTLDLKSGYWQVIIDEESREKTGFSTPDGHYQFKRMAFGLKNAPADFSRIMHIVFKKFSFVEIYLDDITIHSKTLDEHFKHIREVIKACKEASLSLNIKKCNWCAIEISLLGHIISRQGVAMDPKKISAIKDRKAPKNVKDVQVFLGICNYYRRFIKNFAGIALPLTVLLQKDTPFVWADLTNKAFEDLKAALTTYPVLRMPDLTKEFTLFTDASGYALGAVLSQKDDEGKEHVLAYASRTIRGAELHYGITEKECLAVIWAVKQFRIYLYGTKFTIITDHSALAWLMNIQDPTGKLARWAIYLQIYHFDIIHRKGILHTNADTLSRPVLENSIKDGSYEKLVCTLKAINVNNSTALIDPSEDENLLYRLKFGKFRDGLNAKNVRRINGIIENFKLIDDKLFMLKKGSSSEYLEVPRLGERKDKILEAHRLGHFQTESTVNRLNEEYTWRGLENDVEEAIARCKQCHENHTVTPSHHPAQATDIFHIHQRVGIDLVLGLPETTEGYVGCMVTTEYLSKWPTVVPIKTKSAVEIADKLIDYISMYGPPKEILTDQGTEFNNALVAAILNKIGVAHRITSAYNPQTNGQTDRFNGVFVECLCKYSAEDTLEWPKWLPFVCMSYRSRVHSTTGFTPYELLFGRKMLKFKNWTDPMGQNETESLKERSKEIRKLVEVNYVKALENIDHAQVNQKLEQDKRNKIKVDRLPIGTKVYVAVKGIKGKLYPKYRGPFKVIEVTKLGNYILENILKERMADTYPLQRLKVVPDDKDDDNLGEFFSIEKVLRHRTKGKGNEYLVKWKDFPTSENTWEPPENFSDANILDNYWREQKKKSKAKSVNTISWKLGNFSILTLLLILGFVLSVAAENSISIKDKIYFCESITELNTPLIEIDESCDPPAIEPDIINKIYQFANRQFNQAAILSRNSFEVSGSGYECSKQIIQIQTYVNIFFGRSIEKTNFMEQVSEEECRSMVISKTCNGRGMTCEEGVCCYESQPNETYSYLSTHKEEGFKCLVRMRIIKARRPTDKLFGKDCVATDSACRMDNSIIIYNNLIQDCPFSKIKQLNLLHMANAVLYSKELKLAFKVQKVETHCFREMMVTSEGLYIVANSISNNLPSLLVQDIRNRTDSTNLKEVDEVLISKTDGMSLELAALLQATQTQLCQNLVMFLKQLKNAPGSYEVFKDWHGNERVFYSAHGAVFLPTCVVIEEFTLIGRGKLNCTAEFAASFKFNGIRRVGFINQNKIVTNTPTETQTCPRKVIYFEKPKFFVTEFKGVLSKINATHRVPLQQLYSRSDNINLPNENLAMEIYNEYDQIDINKWQSNNRASIKKEALVHINKQSDMSDVADFASHVSKTAGDTYNKAKATMNKIENGTEAFFREFIKIGESILIAIAISIITAVVIAISALSIYFCFCVKRKNDSITIPSVLYNTTPQDTVPQDTVLRMSPYTEAVLDQVVSQSPQTRESIEMMTLQPGALTVPRMSPYTEAVLDQVLSQSHTN